MEVVVGDTVKVGVTVGDIVKVEVTVGEILNVGVIVSVDVFVGVGVGKQDGLSKQYFVILLLSEFAVKIQLLLLLTTIPIGFVPTFRTVSLSLAYIFILLIWLDI